MALRAGAPGAAGLAIYGLVLGAIVEALTLPQAILLWMEPDMEEEAKASTA